MQWSDGALVLTLRVAVREYNAAASLEFLLRTRRQLATLKADVTVGSLREDDGDLADFELTVVIEASKMLEGTWDAWLRQTAEDGQSELRVETRRQNTSYPSLVGLETSLREIRPYDTAAGQLSILVGRPRLSTVPLKRINWDGDVLSVVAEISGTFDAKVVRARAVSRDLTREDLLSPGQGGEVELRFDLASEDGKSAWEFEWELMDRRGRTMWLPLGVDDQSSRPSSAWLLPARRVAFDDGSTWFGASFLANGALTVAPVAPVAASFTKVRPTHRPGLGVRLDLDLDPQPIGVLPGDEVDLAELEEPTLVLVDRLRPGTEPKALQSLDSIARQTVQIAFESPGRPGPETDAGVYLRYRCSGRTYLEPVAVASPAAYRRFPSFVEAALPTLSVDRHWHAIVADTKDKTLRYVRRKRNSVDQPETKLKDRLAAMAASLARATSFEETWLIGENMGTVAQDNGVVFFEHCIQQQKPERVLFVARSNNRHMKRLKQNGEFVVRYNSFAHYYYYHLAHRLVVAHGIRDVVPSLHHQDVRNNEKSVVYLQHGIIAMKKVGYSNESYNGKIHAFVVSSTGERDMMVKFNGMANERLVVTGLPRYDKLERLPSNGSILVMPTWRDWTVGSRETFRNSQFIRLYRSLLTNERLLTALRASGRKVRFYPHVEIENKYRNELDFESDCVDICSYSDSDVQLEIKTCDALVTDYSSVAWDVNYLRKPVYFFQFDQREYELMRGSYVDLDTDLPGRRFQDAEDLVSALIDGISHGFEYDPRSEVASLRYYEYRDRDNSERVYRAIRRLRSVASRR